MRQQMTADLTGVFRLIQSIPSKKAEPFKRWMAQVAAQKERNPQGLNETASTVQEGAEVAKTARDDFEKRLGHSIISSERAIDHTFPHD